MDHLPSLDLPRAATLEFEHPDLAKFTCLGLAYQALRAGGTVPAVLNAANEVAVGAFLDGQIGFLDIARILTDVLAAHGSGVVTGLESLLVADRWARAEARRHLPPGTVVAAAP